MKSLIYYRATFCTTKCFGYVSLKKPTTADNFKIVGLQFGIKIKRITQ